MKVFLVTKGERRTTAQHLLNDGVRFIVATHSRKTLAHFNSINNTFFETEDCIITNKTGVLSTRNAILATVRNDEWFLSLDDDMDDVTSVGMKTFRSNLAHLPTSSQRAPQGYDNWREFYRHVRSYGWLMQVAVKRLITDCERMGAHLGGFASMENPWFRERRYSYYKNVQTGAHLCMRGKLKQMKGGEYAHDQWLGAYMIATYGKNLIDNWIRIDTRPFGDEATGLGPLEQRRASLKRELRNIEQEFRGLVKMAKFPNLHFTLRSEKTIDEWRRAHDSK